MANGTTGTGRGSAGNVIAALCSFFVPGLGQLVQGRVLAAILFFIATVLAWVLSACMLGWIVNVVACLEAAVWRPR